MRSGSPRAASDGRRPNNLIENLLGSEVDEDLLRRVAQAADGNPLYAEESIAMLVERACIEPRDGVWRAVDDLPADLFPDTVDDVVAARIDQLSPDERAVVRAAAVEGMRFHERAVAALTGPAVTGRLPAVLAGLVRKDVIRRDRADLPGGDAYSFRHVVIREAAYESIARGGVPRPPSRLRGVGGGGHGRATAGVRGDRRLPPRAGTRALGRGAGAP